MKRQKTKQRALKEDWIDIWTNVKGKNRQDVLVNVKERKLLKKDRLAYLHENNYNYAIDQSNFENIYTRNKIRLDLIPYIEKEFNLAFVDKISELIGEIKETNIYFQEKLENYIEDEKISIEKVLTLEKFLRKKLINMLLRR